MRPELPAWRQRAACLGADPALWFPENGEPANQAKAVCRTCPVRRECLAYAVQHNIDVGIWGGLSEKKRRGLGQPRPPAEHGTRSCYTAGCRCEPCRDANNTYLRQWNASRLRPAPSEQHRHRNGDGTFARKPADAT